MSYRLIIHVSFRPSPTFLSKRDQFASHRSVAAAVGTVPDGRACAVLCPPLSLILSPGGGDDDDDYDGDNVASARIDSIALQTN